jgi:hypothetical protein
MSTTEITSNAYGYLVGGTTQTFDLTDVFGDDADGYDTAAVEHDYVALVQAIMQTHRPEWTIAGDFIYGPAGSEGLSDDERAEIRDAIAAIDLSPVLQKHAR